METEKGITEEDYLVFVQPYEDALRNVRVRIEVLNDDYRRKYDNYPIHHIQFRIKNRLSVEEKLRRNGNPVTSDEARDQLTDVAGIRIICYFVQDIYAVVAMLKQQKDIVVIKESDYIREPKQNGYRSYHIVFGIPVYHTDGMQYYPVEIQLRTMAMDLWASMEHRICYKSRRGWNKDDSNRFKEYAVLLKQLEDDMMRLPPSHID